MTQNDVFTFTAPNGTEVTGVCIDIMNSNYEHGTWYVRYLCYAQNRLFTINETRCTITVAVDTDEFGDDVVEDQESVTQEYGSILIEYCVIPYYDGVLEAHSMTNNHV